MTLRNTDGTVYQLNKPNPLSIEQELWELEREGYVLHNWDWANVLEEAKTMQYAKVQIAEVKSLPPAPVIIENLPPELPELPELPPMAVQEPPKKIQIPDAVRNKMIMFWCMPTVVKRMQDELYGDVYNKTVFGERFSFEGVMLEKNDLDMTFWTTVKEVSRGSIVFPSKYVYANESCGDYRWWKVQTIKEKAPGILIYCVLSDITPDFT